ncbi:MAG: InlB B-repeat-containing protein [Oscillospiraceae bacterium]|nr:InlB B-repeat-containing protein [Oscillospiraceae bacterium]
MKKLKIRLVITSLLIMAILLPIFPNTMFVSAAAEFNLVVGWTGITEAKSGLLPNQITNSRCDIELTPIVNANVSSETTPSGTNIYPYGVGMEIVFNPPMGTVANVGEIEIRVPIYIFNARDGSRVVSTNKAESMGKHSIQNVGDQHGSGLTLKKIDEENNEYVFTNWKMFSGGDTVVLNILYNFIPDKIKNGFTNKDIRIIASLNPGGNPNPGGELVSENSKTSSPLTVKLNTFVAPPVRYTVTQYREDIDGQKYESWQPGWGAKPTDSLFSGLDVGEIYLGKEQGTGADRYVTPELIGTEKYYYLIWEIWYQYRPNRSTQPYNVNMDIELEPGSLGEIMGVTGVNTLSSTIGWRQDYVQTFIAMSGSNATIKPDKKSAAVNYLVTPTSYDIRSDYPYNAYRWVLVRYPRGDDNDPNKTSIDPDNPKFGYNIDTKINATLTLEGIDEKDKPDEGIGSDPANVTKWAAGQLGATGTVHNDAAAIATNSTHGRGRYNDQPKYTHILSPDTKPYKYIPVLYSIGGLNYRTLQYDLNNYANNTIQTLYSILNNLSEGSVANPVAVPVLRTLSEPYTFRIRAEVDGYSLTCDEDQINANIERHDPRNYYKRDYTVEVTDGMKFIGDRVLTKNDYQISKTYVTYSEYIETINPNNGRLTALTSTNYDGANPAPDKEKWDRGYEPLEIWYRYVSGGDEWFKAGEIIKTGSTQNTGTMTGTNVYTDYSYGTYGTYKYTSTDGTQLQYPDDYTGTLPAGVALGVMSASNQLILPRGTYELKYVHTSSRFRIDITPYTTVELISTNRVRAIIDGGTVEAVTVNGTAFPAVNVTAPINSVNFRNIHTLAVKNWKGELDLDGKGDDSYVNLATANTDSWPGSTGVTNPSATANTANSQNVIRNLSKEWYPETPDGNYTVLTNYRYITLNRTNAATTISKINTGGVRNGWSADQTVAEDGIAEVRSVHQSVVMYERIVFNPDLVPGKTREEKLADMADNKVFNILTQGTFFDLLPIGTYIEGPVEAFTYYVDPENYTSGTRAGRDQAYIDNRLPAEIDYYFVDNWQGSGRTMLIANVKAPEKHIVNGNPEQFTNYQIVSAPNGTTYIGPDGRLHNTENGNASYPERRIQRNDSGYEDIRSGFVLNYKLVATFATIFDRSNSKGDYQAFNAVAFRNKTPGTLGIGATGKLLASGGAVPAASTSTHLAWGYSANGAIASEDANGTATFSTVAPQTRSFFQHLEVEPTAAQDDNRGDTVYQISETVIHIPGMYDFGPKKLVKSQSDPDFVHEAETIPGGIYQYQLHFLAGPTKLYTEIKMFDVLESEPAGDKTVIIDGHPATNYDPGSQWKGRLLNIDTSFAESMGANPVLYYSTLPADEFVISEYKIILDPEGKPIPKKDEHGEPVLDGNDDPVYEKSPYEQLNEYYGDLTNEDVWSILPATKEGIAEIADTITAIAVDLSTGKDNNPFQVKKNESIYVVVNMLAPTKPDDAGDIPGYEKIIGEKLQSVNKYTYSTVEKDVYDPSNVNLFLPVARETFTTKVTMRNVSFGLGKSSFPPSGTNAKPQAVDKDPASGGNTIQYTLSAQNLDILPAANVTIFDELPEGVIFNTADIKFYQGSDASKAAALPSSIKVTRGTGEDSQKLTFVIGEIFAMQTVNIIIPVTVDPDIDFGKRLKNIAEVTSINGAGYSILSGQKLDEGVLEGNPDDGTTYHLVTPRISLNGKATLDGRHIRAGEFVFILKDEDGNEIARVKNDKDGNFIFPPLDFYNADTYTYTITEYHGGTDYPATPDDFGYLGTVPRANLPRDTPGTVDFDDKTYTVTIEVKDNGSGGLTTVVIINDGTSAQTDIIFDNQYSPDPVYMPLDINKVLTGRDMTEDSEFSFKITEKGTGNPVTVYDDSKAVLNTAGILESNLSGFTDFMLKFDKEGKYEYEVREVIPGSGKLDNVDYDDNVFTVTITVGKTSYNPNDGSNRLNSEQRKDGMLSFTKAAEITSINSITGINPTGVTDGISFTNVFTPAPVREQIAGKKVLAGGKLLEDEEFEFELWDVTDPSDHQLIESGVKNDEDGNIVFDWINYTAAKVGIYGKTFIYEVREMKPGEFNKNITYAAPVTVRVVINVDRKKGELSSSVAGVGENGFVITNVYEADAISVPIEVKKMIIGNESDILEEGEFVFTLIDETDDTDDGLWHFPVERRVPNRADGIIPFKNIQFTGTTDKPFKYRVIEESITKNPKIDYDPAVFHFTIAINQDPVTGKLTTANPDKPIEIEGGGPIVFNNIRKYDVTFKLNNETSANHVIKRTNFNTSLGHSTSYANPEGEDIMASDPSREHYEFLGWTTVPDIFKKVGDEYLPLDFDDKLTDDDIYYKDTDETYKILTSDKIFTADTIIGEDMTVYAQWGRIRYVIRYHPGSRPLWDPGPPELVDDTTGYDYRYECYFGGDTPYEWSDDPEEMPHPSIIERESIYGIWTFVGWDYNHDGIADKDSDFPKTVTGDATYYAIWEFKQYYTATYLPGTQGTWSDDYPVFPQDLYDDVNTKIELVRSNSGNIPAAHIHAGNALTDIKDLFAAVKAATGYTDITTIENPELKEKLEEIFSTISHHIDEAERTIADIFAEIEEVIYDLEEAKLAILALFDEKCDEDEEKYMFKRTVGVITPQPEDDNITGNTGYKFIGWKIENTDTDGPKEKIEAEHIRYEAQWDIIKYIVIFNGNGITLEDEEGEIYEPRIAHYGESLDGDNPFEDDGCGDRIPDSPVRPGYIFRGWSTKSGETTASDQDFDEITDVSDMGTKLSKDINGDFSVTVYAIWEAIEYTVKYLPGTQGAWTITDKDENEEYYLYQYTDLIYDNKTPTLTDSEITGNPGYRFTGWEPVFGGDYSEEHFYPPEFTPDPEADLNVANVRPKVLGSVNYIAQWEIIEYTVKFVDGYSDSDNGDDLIKTETVEYGSGAAAPEDDPEREGYTFKGWDKTFNYITGDLIVTALWEINQYTVEFVDENGTVYKTETVDHGSDATAPHDPEREGYTFKGWDKTFDNITEDLTVTATWEINQYIVIFVDGHSDDGYDLIKSEHVNHGNNAPAPEDPEREGYTFKGWDKTFDHITGDLTVTATWELNKYTVTYQSSIPGIFDDQTSTEDHGSSTPPFNGDLDYMLERSTAPGYIFTGWDKTIAPIVTEDVIYTALFEKIEYTVVYDPGANGKWDASDYTYDDLTYDDFNNPPDRPAGSYMPDTDDIDNKIDPHYHFIGWSVVLEDKVIRDIIYVALWERDENFVISYNPNGGNFDPQYHGLLYDGIPYYEDGPTPTPPDAENNAPTGKKFAGWEQKTEDGEPVLWPPEKDLTTIPVTGHTIYTAQWEWIPYTITYLPGGYGDWDDTDYIYTKTPAETLLHYGDPTPPFGSTTDSKDHGWLFDGWDIEWSGTVTGDATYTALWRERYKFTVTFVDGTGNTVDTQEVEEEGSATAPEDPEREGYTFTGWDVDFDNITGDLIVTALWEKNKYNVKFVDGYSDDGDDVIITDIIEYGDGATAPPNPTRPGYTFDGWDSGFDNITEDLTVTAKWRQNAVAPPLTPEPEIKPETNTDPTEPSGEETTEPTGSESNELSDLSDEDPKNPDDPVDPTQPTIETEADESLTGGEIPSNDSSTDPETPESTDKDASESSAYSTEPAGDPADIFDDPAETHFPGIPEEIEKKIQVHEDLHELMDHAIPFADGWFAVDLENGWWEIFDENGDMMGIFHTILPEGIEGYEYEYLEELFANAIPFGEGDWFGVDLGDGWWQIFDEYGKPLGFVLLADGIDITNLDMDFVLINLIRSNSDMTEYESAGTRLNENAEDFQRDNPRTGDIFYMIFGMFILAAGIVFAVKQTSNKKTI